MEISREKQLADLIAELRKSLQAYLESGTIGPDVPGKLRDLFRLGGEVSLTDREIAVTLLTPIKYLLRRR